MLRNGAKKRTLVKVKNENGKVKIPKISKQIKVDNNFLLEENSSMIENNSSVKEKKSFINAEIPSLLDENNQNGEENNPMIEENTSMTDENNSQTQKNCQIKNLNKIRFSHDHRLPPSLICIILIFL